MSEQTALQDIANRMEVWRATYRGKPIEIIVDSVNIEKHTVTVKGEFGNEWTSGGWSPIEKLLVKIADLENKTHEVKG